MDELEGVWFEWICCSFSRLKIKLQFEWGMRKNPMVSFTKISKFLLSKDAAMWWTALTAVTGKGLKDRSRRKRSPQIKLLLTEQHGIVSGSEIWSPVALVFNILLPYCLSISCLIAASKQKHPKNWNKLIERPHFAAVVVFFLWYHLSY